MPGTQCPGNGNADGKAPAKALKDQKVDRWALELRLTQRTASLQPQTCLGRVLFDLSGFKGDLIGGPTEQRGDTQSRERMTVIKL